MGAALVSLWNSYRSFNRWPESDIPSNGIGAARFTSSACDSPCGDFRLLAEILAGFLLKTKCKPEELHEFGASWGRYLAGRPGQHDASRELLRMLEQLGCAARLDGSTVVLSSCPCPLIAPENPPLICHLITAVSRGFLGAASSGLEIQETAHDPVRRLCSLTLLKSAV